MVELSKATVVNCPQCGEVIIWSQSSKFRPFCSERCKLLDLGQWASGTYRIPEEEPSSLDEHQED
ncbi:DNA gyrase inhibitor YacG [Nitrosomonas sp.]|uniref:DNA gyrase inhibitor YacG n=1 Tax=Nitrosomonas sp. TaxID=42353 RepID=UPI00260C0B67|nr:DNA gyrase inhibitor YacG [Nitrosomonas sp.]